MYDMRSRNVRQFLAGPEARWSPSGRMLALLETAMNASGSILVYVGTYTGPLSKGIYLYRFDLGSGSLTPLGLAGATASPSFLAIHPNGRFLFAANELGEYAGQPGGAVSAFAIDPTGRLTPLNQQPTGGAHPCHLTLDQAGAHLMVANYSGGNIAVFPVLPNGHLGNATSFIQHHGSSVNPGRQKGPHAHGIYQDPASGLIFVPDLGLDQVLLYRYAQRPGQLVASEPAFIATKPGAGPRHIAFHSGGRFAYIINEIDSTIAAVDLANRGSPRIFQTIATLPKDFSGPSTTAEIAIHPHGAFLYGSNRGHDSIAVFAIDPAAGTLSLVEHVPTGGKDPRHFAIDPSGRWLLAANQNSHNITTFRVDAGTGRLTPLGTPVEAPSPVCVQWMIQA